MQKSIFKAWLGSFLGLFSLLVLGLFSLSPVLTEYLYARGLFWLLRWLVDYTWGLLPFAAMYWFWPLLIYGFWRALRASGIFAQGLAWSRRLALAGRFGLNALGLVLAWFLWAWGYNYRRTAVETQLGWAIPELDVQRLRQEAQLAQDSSLACRARIPEVDTLALEARHFPAELEDEMRRLLVLSLQEQGYPTPGRVRGRLLRPQGLLLRSGASGIYWPFIGEGHVDAALHPIQQPFTLAHELAHGYGFGDEAICNFWGFMACMKSHDPAIRYSGFMAYRLYVLMELRALDPQAYAEVVASNSPGMLQDRKAIQAVFEHYPEFFPAAQKAAYEVYLQSQGVKEGLRSYNRMVELVAAWHQRQGLGH